jgi:o-succinylbenzoate synthase
MGFELRHKIEYWPYTLKARQTLNSQTTRREIEGALVRINGGVGCLQPWPEFGDIPLDRQLRILARGGLTALTERCWVCCNLDGAARRNGYSEFREFIMPETHTLIPGQGPILKVKCGPDISSEASRVKELAKSHQMLRLDFNTCLTLDQFMTFCDKLDSPTVDKLDFVEDPFRGSQGDWDWAQKKLDFDLAADREPVVAAVRVEKPAVDDVRRHPARVVFTSNMDHPIGQLFAAREAAAFYSAVPERTEVCGLASHVVFEPDPFIERMAIKENRLVPLGGTGFGFDDLLENLPWQTLLDGPLPNV